MVVVVVVMVVLMVVVVLVVLVVIILSLLLVVVVAVVVVVVIGGGSCRGGGAGDRNISVTQVRTLCSLYSFDVITTFCPVAVLATVKFCNTFPIHFSSNFTTLYVTVITSTAH
jgi:hypothetical protein